MYRIWVLLIFLIVLAVALPAILNAIEVAIPLVIGVVALVGIGRLLYYRRR